MQHVRLGNSGLKVSRLCLGCMTYGDPAWRPWVLDEERARPFIREALEAGIDFFDSADIYSTGESERILGRALRDFAQREDLVIATKAFFPMSDRPNACGLSRKHLLASVDASLRRLGTDYLDLFVIHRFDPDTPIAETCETLDSLVRVGKVRYLGASSMPAWRFMKMLAFQRHHGLAQFISMQSQYNLIVREDEEDLVPLCREEGIALTPWSPLARGLLAGARSAGTLRTRTDEQAPRWYGGREEVESTLGALEKLAAARGLPPAQLALAWLLGRNGVAAPIVGLSRPHHLEDALAALTLDLTEEECATLEAPLTVRARPRAGRAHIDGESMMRRQASVLLLVSMVSATVLPVFARAPGEREPTCAATSIVLPAGPGIPTASPMPPMERCTSAWSPAGASCASLPGRVETFFAGSPAIFAATALRLDEPRGLLWGNSPDFLPAGRRRPHGVFALDLETGAVRRYLTLPGDGMGNDLAVAPDGTVYLSETRDGSLMRLRPGNRRSRCCCATAAWPAPAAWARRASSGWTTTPCWSATSVAGRSMSSKGSPRVRGCARWSCPERWRIRMAWRWLRTAR